MFTYVLACSPRHSVATNVFAVSYIYILAHSSFVCHCLNTVHRIDPDLATSAMPDSRPAPRGMPHRCLRIPEIQMQIFSLLPRTACDSLAQTCTAFYEQAMDIVWAEVTTFTPLVQCIRSETLMIEENNDPKRSVYRQMRTLVSVFNSTIHHERLTVTL